MKRVGKIGRWGRAAIVAAACAGIVVLSVPVANAANDWEVVDRDQPATQTVTKIKKPASTLVNDWE